MQRVHGTCVALGTMGLLITGPSGSGKSDLALRLIERGAKLVADDQVEIYENLIARAPPTIAGLIEVRGVGVLEILAQDEVRLCAVLAPVREEGLERVPARASTILAGAVLPLLRLPYLQASTPLKVRMWLEQCVNPVNLPVIHPEIMGA
jgi:HPr kinase/phosphorylase